VFAIELCYLQRISFCCRIVLSARNQCSLSNNGGCRESTIHCQIIVSVVNKRSLLNCVVFRESIFIAEL